MLRVVVSLVLSALLAGPTVRAARAQCSGGVIPIREARYEMDLRVDYQEEKLAARLRLTVENRSETKVTLIPLLLYRLLSIESVRDAEGRELDFEQRVVGFADFPQLQVNHVEVLLARPLAAGARTTIDIAYSGYLLGYVETGMRYVQDRVDPAFTIIRPDSWAYPMVGYPCMARINAAGLPSFEYRVRVTVPDSLTVANGGTLEDRSAADGLATYVYASQRPAWRMDFAVAPYGLRESGRHRVFYLPGDSAGAASVIHALESSLALFGDWFGPLHGDPGLTVIEIPDGWGSQKDETTIIQSAAAFRDARRLRELYHEVSHFWNVTPLDRPAPRWEEGLASFLEYRAAEVLDGGDLIADRSRQIIEWLRDLIERHPEYLQVPLVDYGHKRLTDLSYSVGMVFFAILHELVGEREFNQIIGGYYQTYREMGASTADFVQYARRASSHDLEPLFEDWFYSTRWSDRLREQETSTGIARSYRK